MEDSIVGVFDRERLSDGLVALHRAGFGPQARVLDPARGDLASQLRRIGVELPLDALDDRGDTALVVVSAAGREAAVAAALERAGARAVRRVSRDGPAFAVATTGPAPARSRGGRRAGRPATPARGADRWPVVPEPATGDEAPVG